ncbi:hypothetical protein LWC34_31320 [Kibdelosporangium philippinense]|uniref:Uncharacterized protein n=1 Tax=Kibdelosporangium philippinense TaxID=211113 RepID=A0ABS8ZHM9_9PSEU|nr:hypothetical protein [Kibdelosporangium philippinense]MCE7007280.1 hypothetical protein [Kibdelosporangium philippinense]
MEQVRRFLMDLRRPGPCLQRITTRTIDLVNTAVIAGDIAARDAFDLMRHMTDVGRHLRLPNLTADLQR